MFTASPTILIATERRKGKTRLLLLDRRLGDSMIIAWAPAEKRGKKEISTLEA